MSISPNKTYLCPAKRDFQKFWEGSCLVS